MSDDLTIDIQGRLVTMTMEAWLEVSKQISARHYADVLIEMQAKRDAGQVWWALYWRHYSRQASECFSYDEARDFVDNEDDYSSVGILMPDGTIELQLLYAQEPTDEWVRLVERLKVLTNER